MLSIDEGKISVVEAKVNLNRQRYYISLERESRVELMYNICKDKAFDYSSQCKISAGGVRYGHLKFKMNEDKANTTEVILDELNSYLLLLQKDLRFRDLCNRVSRMIGTRSVTLITLMKDFLSAAE